MTRAPLALVAVAFAVALPAYAQTPAPGSATPAPPATPVATPSPKSTPPLIATFPPSLGATPGPVYNYVVRPSATAGSTPFPIPGTPEIIEIDVSDQALAAPGPLHARVVTNDVVISVVAEAYGYELDIPKSGNGIFTFDGIIPIVPDAAKGKRFDVDVVATTKDGRTATVTLSFMLK